MTSSPGSRSVHPTGFPQHLCQPVRDEVAVGAITAIENPAFRMRSGARELMDEALDHRAGAGQALR